MLYWIGLLVSWCAGFLVAGFFFRRHYKNYQDQIAQRKQALRAIMYQTHHEGINPICKRIRGITSLGLMLTGGELKPNSLPEIRNYFSMIEKEALELETSTLEKVKEFEHLQ